MKKTRPLITIIFNSKILVSRSEILSSLLILGVLGVVTGASNFDFVILIATSDPELPANLPSQFSLTAQTFFALGSSNSEGAR